MIVNVAGGKNIVSLIPTALFPTIRRVKIELNIEVSEFLVNNWISGTLHHRASFLNAPKPAQTDLCKVYSQNTSDLHFSFLLFMPVEFQGQCDSRSWKTGLTK